MAEYMTEAELMGMLNSGASGNYMSEEELLGLGEFATRQPDPLRQDPYTRPDLPEDMGTPLAPPVRPADLGDRVGANALPQANPLRQDPYAAPDLSDKMNPYDLTPGKPDDWVTDLGQGVTASVGGMEEGIKDLFGGGSEVDRQNVRDLREDAAESGWGDLGRYGTDVGMLALPGSGVVRATTGGKRLAQAAKLAGIDTAIAGAMGGARLPQSDEHSRLAGAGREAVGSLAGHGIASGLSKLTRGISRTPDANRLLREGVELTPGAASKAGLWKVIEKLQQLSPVGSRATKKQHEKALDTFNEGAIKRASYGNVSGSGHQAVGETARNIGGEMAEILEKAAAKAADKGGRFSPSQLMDAIKKVSGEEAVAAGTAPLQGYARAGMNTIEEIDISGVVLGPWRKMMQHVPDLGLGGSLGSLGGRAAMGTTKPQKLTQKALDEAETAINALRKAGVRPGVVGATAGEIWGDE